MITLKDKQEAMKDKLEERKEIESLLKRTDLVCPKCRKAPTRASKRTGVPLVCKRCANRKNYLLQKKRKRVRSRKQISLVLSTVLA